MKAWVMVEILSLKVVLRVKYMSRLHKRRVSASREAQQQTAIEENKEITFVVDIYII